MIFNGNPDFRAEMRDDSPRFERIISRKLESIVADEIFIVAIKERLKSFVKYCRSEKEFEERRHQIDSIKMKLKDSCIGGIGTPQEEPKAESSTLDRIKRQFTKESLEGKKNEIMGFIGQKFSDFKGEKKDQDNEYDNYFSKKSKNSVFDNKEKPKGNSDSKTYEFPSKPSSFNSSASKPKAETNNYHDLISFEEKNHNEDFKVLYESSNFHYLENLDFNLPRPGESSNNKKENAELLDIQGEEFGKFEGEVENKEFTLI